MMRRLLLVLLLSAALAACSSSSSPATPWLPESRILVSGPDTPVAFFVGHRLFVVARKHLQPTGRKRTALFELGGAFGSGGILFIDERGELPSAGDTSYAGAVPLDATRVLVSWYSGVIEDDLEWLSGMLAPTDIWIGTIDTAELTAPL